MQKTTKTISLGKSLARINYSSFAGKLKARKSAFSKLKDNLTFGELCNAVDFLGKNINQSLQNIIWGNPLPDSYENLGVIKERPYLGEDIYSELNLVLIGIRKYKYEINLFIKYKEIYETNLLIGNYKLAKKYLTKIESEVCHSLWTIENRFILEEFSGNASENKELLSKFNRLNKSKGATKYLVHFLSQRAEKSLSINRYVSDLELSLSSLKEGKFKNPNIDYYRFKLTFLGHLEFKSYKEILAFDFSHSIIDRYLDLMKVQSNLLTVSKHLDHNDSTNKYIKNRINYLLKKIDDPILFKLKLFSSEKLFPAFNIKESKREIEIIDKYTIGLYSEVEEEIKKLLLEKPTQFGIYIIYIKSLIYQKKEFKYVGNIRSIQNEILRNMYSIISVDINPNDAAMNLLRISNNLSSCALSLGIVDFTLSNTKGKEERKLLARLSYNAANPNIHEIYSDEKSKLNYLNLLSEKFPHSITIDFFQSKLKDKENLVKFKNLIPKAKYKLECARILQDEKRIEEAINIWKELIYENSETNPILEIAIRNLFICYESIEKYDSCIKLYVDSYFKNNFIIEKIETKNLLLKIRKNRFKNVNKGINLPIFYTIVKADENEEHITFEQFNINQNVTKSSELLEHFEKFRRDKIIFFFKNTCRPEILKHSVFISNTRERLEERLTISQFLKTKDEEGKKFYEDEIKDIQNILIIQQGLIELDESKIYVNEQGIIDNELKDYEAIFERFKIIGGISNKKRVSLISDGKLTTIDYSDENFLEEKIEYSSNPVFDIYSELFDAIKNRFLYSQFGIVAYLSTRIRHGVLIGEIRPIFEKYNLITLREGSSQSYRSNSHWDNHYQQLPEKIKTNLQVILKRISSEIDGLIFDLIKKHLQVYQVESNKEGWFNYEFRKDDLFWYSLNSLEVSDYQEFIQKVFLILWARTDENLGIIRKKIKEDISEKFNNILSNLELEIINLLGAQSSQPILKSIKDCSTETQTVISKISRWFKRSRVKATDFHLENLIQMVMDYANKSNLRKRIELEKDLKFKSKIRGEYLTHFADLFRIFMENILKHSSDEITLIPSKITTSETENGFLKIGIENNITDKSSLKAIKSVWNGNKIDISKLHSEGKSGYHKAYKIITSDLNKSIKNKNTFITRTSTLEDKFYVTILISLKGLLA